MRTDGIFIGIEVSDDAIAREPKLASQLSQVCPVDIYREAGDGVLEIVAENVDECVLCRLCLEISAVEVAEGDVRVLKLYDGGVAL
jgi:ferredoxin-like protein FixX